ncbi:MAG TPA: hypothetical protein VHM90_02940, partial [Phycisphaerae bacterium]|nr:hypothetical protein [Phycisphaerae bacterium]
RSVGLVRLYAAADGKMLAETRIANIASDSPPQTRTSSTARAPSAVAIPRPLLLFSIIGFTTALLALGALLYRLNRARPYSAQGA